MRSRQAEGLFTVLQSKPLDSQKKKLGTKHYRILKPREREASIQRLRLLAELRQSLRDAVNDDVLPWSWWEDFSNE